MTEEIDKIDKINSIQETCDIIFPCCLLIYLLFAVYWITIRNKSRDRFIITMLTLIFTYLIASLSRSLLLHAYDFDTDKMTSLAQNSELILIAILRSCVNLYQWLFSIQYLQASFLIALLHSQVEIKLSIQRFN